MADENFRKDVELDRKALKEFNENFPYRKNTALIDELTPEKIYNRGSRDTFFYYFLFKLRRVGAISWYGEGPWRAARENSQTFKELLKLLIDDAKPIHKKIDDDRWNQLKGWGGDKHYAKKLLFAFYPEKILPTFKTELLESQIYGLDLNRDAELESKRRFNENLSNLSVGKKFELYNHLLLDNAMEALTRLSGFEWDPCAIARLLGDFVPHPKPLVNKAIGGPLSEMPILYEPVNELGVVLLFGMYHKELGFPYIIKVQQKFPDMVALDEEGNYCRIEFEYRSSAFLEHGHDPDGSDFIVCWEDDLEEGHALKDKVISLKKEIFESKQDEKLE